MLNIFVFICIHLSILSIIFPRLPPLILLLLTLILSLLLVSCWWLLYAIRFIVSIVNIYCAYPRTQLCYWLLRVTNHHDLSPMTTMKELDELVAFRHLQQNNIEYPNPLASVLIKHIIQSRFTLSFKHIELPTHQISGLSISIKYTH